MREKSSSEDLKSRRTGFTRTTKTASSVVGAVAVAFIVILVCLTIGVAQSNAPRPSSAALTALTQTSLSAGTPQFSYGLTSPNAQLSGAFGYSVAISGSAIVVGALFETASGEDTAGHAYTFNANTGDLISTLTSPNPQTNGDFGLSVAISGATVAVGALGETASGDSDAGHAYTFNATTGDLISTLSSPNAQTDGFFGSAVAISGTTVVVGAPWETVSGESEAGHVYTFNATTGDLISTLSSPNAQPDGRFGQSVAISGTTVLVGAPRETASGHEEAGHAYAFSAATGDLISTFTSPNAQTYGEFGYSVAISGTTVVAGTPFENASGETQAGQAYTFSFTTGDLISTLTSPNAQSYGEFGYSVAISGTRLAVGANGETASGDSGAGHAYTFSATTGDLIWTLTSPNAQLGGYFGHSVAISGTTVVVGAYGETASGYTTAGHAYIFTPQPLAQVFTSPNAQLGGYFGWSVAISGTTVVVGAPDESTALASEAGHAYIVNTKTGIVTVLTSPNAQYTGYFGESVAISGTTVVVGAPGETVSGESYAGHAYIINTKTGLVRVLTSPNAQYDGQFGRSVAISGKTVVVGAYGETASNLSGAGHAYTFNVTTGDLISTLTSPNARIDGGFGWSVAISGAKVAVGAPSEMVKGKPRAGHAYLFNATTGGLISTFTSPNAHSSGAFGASVAISGTTVVVGAYGENASGESGSGHAYTFSVATGDLLLTLTSPKAQHDGYFGWSVAISGTTVVVGAYGERASGYYEPGHTYTFTAAAGHLIWTLTSPNAQYQGWFGLSVAINGPTVVVGAPLETASGEINAGYVYLY